MSHHKKTSETHEEVKPAFEGAAQVIPAKKMSSKLFLPIFIVVVGVIVLMLFFGKHAEKVDKETASRQQKILEASSVIEQRLAALKNTVESGETPQLPNEQPRVTRDSPEYPKELIARMNAPTSLYESGVEALAGASGSKSGKEVNEATFVGKGEDASFGNQAATTSTVAATQVPHPESTIVSGEMIHATLSVASNSDLPGMVTAIVSTPAYSYTGENELIPAGSRLVGQYNSAVLQGQSRIFIMWNRLVLPNGVSVDINSPDTDQIGQAGEPADYVNRRFWSRFGESILLSILSAGVSNVDVQSSDQYNSAQAYRMAMAESFQQSAAGTLQQTISLKPTLVRYQGATINVFIAHDLSFYNVLRQQQGVS